MAANNTPAPETEEVEDAPEDSEATERRPYIVVLMSEEMKAAAQAFAKENGSTATAIARRALADAIGYNLDSEPAPVIRRKYDTVEEKAAGRERASKKSALQSKLLRAGHNAQIRKNQALQLATNKWLLELYEAETSDPATMDVIKRIEADLAEAQKKK